MLINLNDLAHKLESEFSSHFKHRDFSLNVSFKAAYADLLAQGKFNLGYRDVVFHKHSAEIITSTGKIISIPNFWFISAAHFSQYIPALYEYKHAVLEIGKSKGLPKTWIADCKDQQNVPFNQSDVGQVTGDAADYDFLQSFLTQYDWWKGAKSIDRSDFYVSPILKLGNFLAESQSAIAEIAHQISNFSDQSLLGQTISDFLGLSVPDFKNDETSLLLSKPFLLLAGISGTGKSRFVRQQAKAQGTEQEYFKLVPVRPDWHEPSDLLGYVSRIGETAKFIVTDPLRFMVKAWRAAGAQAITLPDGTTGWSGKPLNTIKTYWLCLDEMNLAPVEQYFADYLSVIESRTWLYEEKAAGEDYVYCCAPILPASFLNAVADAEEKKLLAQDLGLNIESSSEDKQLWEAFLQQGIPVPFNLVVAGTVNMDETTHGFSRKVIDRALTFDFGRFFPNNFNQLLTPETQPQPVKLQFSRLSNASLDSLKSCQSDPDGQKTIQFLQSVNQVLHDTPFELAYRALNELLLAVISHNPQTDSDLQAVWDDFLMCKVLPRIEGDDEKLAGNSGAKNTSHTLLDDLTKLLSTALPLIWDQVRPDLLRMNIPATEPVLCRSKAKLEWMKGRLARNSFTSFWP